MKKVAIQVNTSGKGRKNITAYKKGDFGIHHNVFNYAFWTLTHVPTGRAIKDELKFKWQAVELADKLIDATCSDVWSEKDRMVLLDRLEPVRDKITSVLSMYR